MSRQTRCRSATPRTKAKPRSESGEQPSLAMALEPGAQRWPGATPRPDKSVISVRRSQGRDRVARAGASRETRKQGRCLKRHRVLEWTDLPWCPVSGFRMSRIVQEGTIRIVVVDGRSLEVATVRPGCRRPPSLSVSVSRYLKRCCEGLSCSSKPSAWDGTLCAPGSRRAKRTFGGGSDSSQCGFGCEVASIYKSSSLPSLVGCSLAQITRVGPQGLRPRSAPTRWATGEAAWKPPGAFKAPWPGKQESSDAPPPPPPPPPPPCRVRRFPCAV